MEQLEHQKRRLQNLASLLEIQAAPHVPKTLEELAECTITTTYIGERVDCAKQGCGKAAVTVTYYWASESVLKKTVRCGKHSTEGVRT